MTIALVLADTPAYSETFFNSKIKGLLENGFEVVLYPRKQSNDFTLCKVVSAPDFSGNAFHKLGTATFTVFKLLTHLKQVQRFVQWEQQSKRSFKTILKNVFINSHLLTAKADWVHFGFATLAVGSENVAKAIDAKMAVSFRGFDIAIYPLKGKSCYHLLWKRIDKIHTISDDLLEKAYKLGLDKNVSHEKITPAIDTAFFKGTKTTGQSNELTLLTIARLNWKKGLDEALVAMKKLKKKNIRFKYFIVGSGTKTEIERISYLIFQFGLTDHVELLGKRSKEEIKDLLQQIDIYVQYSISEGFCNAVLEAQAMGKLVIVSNAEGLSENVAHLESGWVIERNSPQLLANTIQDVWNMEDSEKETFRQRAIERVLKRFTIEQQQQQFVAFYTTS